MNFRILNIIAIILFIIDRIIKDIFFEKLLQGSFLIFKDFLGGVGFFGLINNGAVLGILVHRIILILIISLILTFLGFKIFEFYKTSQIKLCFIFFVVFLGGLSNLIDRIFYGGVLDYIKIFIWPIFNFADILVVIGVVLLGINLFYIGKENSKKT